MSDEPALPEGGPVRSGFVALVGRPNAGKSTMTNALVGEKVAIVSDTPQTTRHRLRAIVDTEDAQIVLVDTPGLHKPIDALGEEVNRSALLALADVDVVCLMIDATKPVGTGDRWVASQVVAAEAEAILIVSKTDLVDQEVVEERVAEASELAGFIATARVSSVTGDGLEGLLGMVTKLLPEGPRYFPRDMRTDQPLEVLLAEFIREKVLWHTHEEVPHAVGVAIEDLRHEKKNDTTVVEARVFVERESQKPIVIGKGGAMIKLIGSEAREDLERLLGGKVFLELRVKVMKDWRRDASRIRRFGYGDGL
jgi:GTP-binding protein Era